MANRHPIVPTARAPDRATTLERTLHPNSIEQTLRNTKTPLVGLVSDSRTAPRHVVEEDLPVLLNQEGEGLAEPSQSLRVSPGSYPLPALVLHSPKGHTYARYASC